VSPGMVIPTRLSFLHPGTGRVPRRRHRTRLVTRLIERRQLDLVFVLLKHRTRHNQDPSSIVRLRPRSRIVHSSPRTPALVPTSHQLVPQPVVRLTQETRQSL